MKKLIIFMFSIVLFGSCSYTTYDGTLIFNKNVSFNKPNFKYITTIEGSATAEWTGFWISRHEKVNGLINEAKKNMYKNHVFSPNQIVTNLTKDVVSTSGGDGGKNRLHVKVIMSGDIYEFFNGSFLQTNNKQNFQELNIDNSKISENTNPELNIDNSKISVNKSSIVNRSNINITKLKLGYKEIDKYTSLRKGYTVLFKNNERFYKGLLMYKTNSSAGNKEYRIANINVFNEKENKWVIFDKENETITETAILGYKL